MHEYTDYGLLNNVEYYYAVTAFSKPDTLTGFQSLESGVALSREVVIPGTQVPETVGEVYVVPNPYRGDLDYSSYKPPWEKPDPIRNQQNLPGKNRWTEFDRWMQFVNVPSPSEIKIYTLAGDLVNTLYHGVPELGIKDWNLTSMMGQTVASGIYLFTVEDQKNSSSKYANKGLSTLILYHALAFCKLNRIKTLMLKVHPDNSTAKNLYEKLGFKQTGFDEKINNIIYQKPISL